MGEYTGELWNGVITGGMVNGRQMSESEEQRTMENIVSVCVTIQLSSVRATVSVPDGSVRGTIDFMAWQKRVWMFVWFHVNSPTPNFIHTSSIKIRASTCSSARRTIYEAVAGPVRRRHGAIQCGNSKVESSETCVWWVPQQTRRHPPYGIELDFMHSSGVGHLLRRTLILTEFLGLE
jgi:hypothetical protein